MTSYPEKKKAAKNKIEVVRLARGYLSEIFSRLFSHRGNHHNNSSEERVSFVLRLAVPFLVGISPSHVKLPPLEFFFSFFFRSLKRKSEVLTGEKIIFFYVSISVVKRKFITGLILIHPKFWRERTIWDKKLSNRSLKLHFSMGR